MKAFSFTRFVTLLARVLEISIVSALAFRWLDVFVGIRYGTDPFGRAVEAAVGFSFLAIVLLLLASLWLLLTRQPRAARTALRTLVCMVAFLFTPYRLGGSALQTAQRPNQPMQRTANQPAIYLLRVCHSRFGCVARFTGLAVADLVSR